jgi:septum formation topological specificity factor MinE
MLVFNNYFCKNRKSKLHFGDRVAVLLPNRREYLPTKVVENVHRSIITYMPL